MTLYMYEYMQSKKLQENLTIADINDINQLIDQNMKEIENKMAVLGWLSVVSNVYCGFDVVYNLIMFRGIASNFGKQKSIMTLE